MLVKLSVTRINNARVTPLTTPKPQQEMNIVIILFALETLLSLEQYHLLISTMA